MIAAATSVIGGSKGKLSQFVGTIGFRMRSKLAESPPPSE